MLPLISSFIKGFKTSSLVSFESGRPEYPFRSPLNISVAILRTLSQSEPLCLFLSKYYLHEDVIPILIFFPKKIIEFSQIITEFEKLIESKFFNYFPRTSLKSRIFLFKSLLNVLSNSACIPIYITFSTFFLKFPCTLYSSSSNL